MSYHFRLMFIKKEKETSRMKVGLIRCMQTEDMCPATTCLKVMSTKKLAFKDIEEDIEVVGVNTCGGCPGKKAATRAAEMVRRGADTVSYTHLRAHETDSYLVCR